MTSPFGMGPLIRMVQRAMLVIALVMVSSAQSGVRMCMCILVLSLESRIVL